MQFTNIVILKSNFANIKLDFGPTCSYALRMLIRMSTQLFFMVCNAVLSVSVSVCLSAQLSSVSSPLWGAITFLHLEDVAQGIITNNS